MASWKDGKGLYTWGTYSNRGDHTKIYVVGGPGGGDSNYFYISNEDMSALRARNFGTGVHFWWEGKTLKVTINLLILTARDDYRVLSGERVKYVGDSSVDYNFFANLQYQTRDGQWHKLGDHLVNTHYGGEPIYPKEGWDTQKSGYLWNTFSFPDINIDDVKQFSLGIHGDYDEVGNWVYYPIEQIKPTPKKVNLRVKYVDAETGRELASPIVYSVDAGTSHREEAKVIQGYTPRQTFFQLNINEDTEFTFRYNRNREYRDVTVEYVEEGTGRKLRDSIVLYRQEVGTNVSAPAQPIQGYHPDSSYKTILVDKGTNVIRFIYSRNITYIRPWAIRKAGVWKSFTTNSTNMIKRVGGSWSKKDTSMDSSLAGRDKSPSDTNGNKSASYIRKSGSWKRQGKIGS